MTITVNETAQKNLSGITSVNTQDLINAINLSPTLAGYVNEFDANGGKFFQATGNQPTASYSPEGLFKFPVSSYKYFWS